MDVAVRASSFIAFCAAARNAPLDFSYKTLCEGRRVEKRHFAQTSDLVCRLSKVPKKAILCYKYGPKVLNSVASYGQEIALFHEPTASHLVIRAELRLQYYVLRDHALIQHR